MIFLDHVKFLYSTDIKLLESEGLIDVVSAPVRRV